MWLQYQYEYIKDAFNIQSKQQKTMTKYQYAQLVAFQYCERFNPDSIWI